MIKAAQGDIKLYFDIHQNGGQRIEVATVGISKEDARFVKNTYLRLRDKALAGRSDVAVTEVAIEPLDEIEVGAWAAKGHGILAVVKQGLHLNSLRTGSWRPQVTGRSTRISSGSHRRDRRSNSAKPVSGAGSVPLPPILPATPVDMAARLEVSMPRVGPLHDQSNSVSACGPLERDGIRKFFDIELPIIPLKS